MVNSVVDADQALYLVVQVALRKVIGTLDIDEVLERREQLGELIHTQAKESPEQFGMRLLSVDIKDITFPGSLKQTFAQVVKARHDGLAALERARGEAAALRSLANTAKILDGNPTLMNLRLLQSLDESSGNSLVLKVTGEKAV